MSESLCTVGRRGDVRKYRTSRIEYHDHGRVDVTYIANWTLPSLSPPMTRESKYDANVVLFIHLRERKSQYIRRISRVSCTHTRAESILPIIVIKSIFLRPYLSERDPMYGDTMN